MLLAMGTRRPFSKSRTVLRDTFARFAKSSWLQSNQPRAARLCLDLNTRRVLTALTQRQR